MNIREVNELFHLLFLSFLSRKVDQRLFAVKGGCNLRFYFQSIRYSEDIDFDVHTILRQTLRSNVQRILSDRSLGNFLLSRGVSIVNFTEPKQTDTTQRWKVSLRLEDIGRDIPTKIEFSRRSGTDDAIMEAVDPAITTAHRLSPIHASHYPRTIAIVQKVQALIDRAETQARDVFDLDLLSGGESHLAGKLSKEDAKQANQSIASLSFADFKGQVVAYLPPEYQAQYDDVRAWEAMCERVVAFIGRSER